VWGRQALHTFFKALAFRGAALDAVFMSASGDFFGLPLVEMLVQTVMHADRSFKVTIPSSLRNANFMA
jgi:hypothetical protein